MSTLHDRLVFREDRKGDPVRKAYVAASSQEPDISEAETLIRHLKSLGYDVYDWPRQVREVVHEPPICVYEMAREEYQWIQQCDLFVLLAPPIHSGALVEFGFALACQRKILVIRPDRRATIFRHLVEWTAPTIEDAMRELSERVWPEKQSKGG